MNVYTPASDRIVHHTYADFTDRLVPRPIHLVQYDMSLPIIAVTLYNDGQTYELPADVEVNIRWHKRDNNIVYNPALGCNDRRNIVYFEITKQMTILEGITEPVVEIMINGSQVANSGSFKVIVDRNPVTSEELASASEAKALYEFVEMAETAAFHAKESADSASASEGNAMASAASALTSETRSKASEDNAALSEVNAKTSETNAAASEAIAKTAETNAVAAATTVMNMADESEAWAVGTKGGVPVAPTDPQSGNSAKDWARVAQAAAQVGPATPTVPGLVKPDNITIKVDPDGTIHAQANVDIATATQVGVMKPDGTTTWVDADGTLHAKGGGGGGQGGSVVKIITREASFEGLDVVVTNGVESVTGKIVGGVCEVNTTQTGTYTATITESGDTYMNSVNIPYFGVYEIEINKFSAEITVNLNGGVTVDVQAEVTATHTDGSAFKYTISSGEKIRVGKTGAYTIQAKIDGMPSSTANVSIADETPKSVTVKFAKLTVDVECETSANLTVTNGTEVFSIVATSDKTVSKYVALGTWVVSGDIDGTDVSASVEITDYVEKSVTVKGKKAGGFDSWVKSRFPSSTATSIDELDEKQIRELMTVHDSVDILVDWLKDDAEAALEILSYDLCAKWINLRDYALDKLSENETIKAVMDKTVVVHDVPQVPNMTSNTEPSGEAGAWNTQSGTAYYPYKAFSGSNTDRADMWASDKLPTMLYYKFDDAKVIKKATVTTRKDISTAVPMHVKIVATNDYSTDIQDWVELADYTNSVVQSDYSFNIEFNNTISYLYYGLYIVTSNDTSGYVHIGLLQFYADEYDTKYGYGEWVQIDGTWQPKGNVPIMTANDAPYGTAIRSSTSVSSDAMEAYKVFDNNESTNWGASANSTDNYIGYTFVNPTIVKKAKLHISKGGSLSAIKIVLRASNVGGDNANWTSLSDEITVNESKDVEIIVDNNTPYLYYSIQFLGKMFDGGYQSYMVSTLQFYGRELKVSVPKMDSNNSPWGEVTCNSENTANSRFGYCAFQPITKAITTSTCWEPNPADTKDKQRCNIFIVYDFGKSVNLKSVLFYVLDGNSRPLIKLFSVHGSNDNFISDDNILLDETQQNKINAWVPHEINTDKTYRYYKFIYLGEGNTDYKANNGQAFGVNFYGLDYSEREFEPDGSVKFLYDHGVELEPIGLYIGTGCIAEKRSNSIILKNLATNNTAYAYASDDYSLDTTDYNFIRCTLAQEIIDLANGHMNCYNKTESQGGDSTFVVDNSPYNNSLNIKNINDYCRLCLTAGVSKTTGTIEFTEWWLE